MILALLTLALAHHDSAVAQVGGGAERGWAAADDRIAPLELGASLGWTRFGRTLRGAERVSPIGRVDVAQIGVRAAVGLTPAVAVEAMLPVGVVATDGQADPVGVGDAALGLALRPVSGHRTRLGVGAPTGRLADEASVTAVDVLGTDGELRLTTYDTRASLGTGTWAAVVEHAAGVPVGEVVLRGAASLELPVGRTRDGVRWGATAVARAGATGPVGGEAVRWLGWAEVERHFADDVPGVDEVTLEQVYARTGRRLEVGAGAGLLVRLDAQVDCAAQAQLPLWQHAQGVQLMRSVAVVGGCTARWGAGASGG